MSRHYAMSVAAALLGALLVALGILSRQWWVIDGPELSGSLSPLGVRACAASTCHDVLWLLAGAPSERVFVRAANITLVASLVSVLLLLAASLVAWLRGSPLPHLSPTRVALLLCPVIFIGGVLFLVLLPESYRGPDLHLGFGAAFHFVGATLGTAGAFGLTRQRYLARP